MKGLGG